MFREAWRLQREHFWIEDMSGLDWDAIYQRYLPLVDRVTTRSEFSDLLWELQGELGTSHAYEIGGEYRPGPTTARASSASTGSTTPPAGSYRIGRIVEGDPWDPRRHLAAQPARASTSRPATWCWRSTASRSAAPVTPGERLVNQADQEVLLTIQRGDERAAHGRRQGAGRRAGRPATATGSRRNRGRSTRRRTAGSATSTSRTWARRASPSSTAATWSSTTARAC